MKTKIHIWDLPIEKIYVKLKEGFREKIFEGAHKRFGSWVKAGRFFKIKRGDTALAKNWKMGQYCCPLTIIFKISKTLNISKNEVEKNIKEIKYKTKLDKRGGNSGRPILDPKLPIIINEDFAEILGHICGDGTIIRKNPKKGIKLGYVNSEPKLIESFQEKIKNVFGDVKADVQIRDGARYKRKNFYLQYPSIVSLFILSVFDYKTGEEMDVPNFIFKMSKKCQCSFLRALFDDEGTVDIKEKRIVIGLKPQKPIEQIRNLLIYLKFCPTKIYKSGNILKISLQKKEDINLFNRIIGFKHPIKKRKLNIIIKAGWKFDRDINQEFRKKILLFLRERRSGKTKEIIKYLNKSPSSTRKYLSKLKNKNLILSRRVRNERSNGWNYLWSLK